MQGVLLLLLLAVPGIAASCALFPEAISLRTSERGLLAVVLGASLALATGLAMAAFGVFGGASGLSGALFWTIVALAWARLRGAEGRAIFARARDELWSPSAAAALAILVLAVGLHALALHQRPLWIPAVSWYYLADILAILRAGDLPAVNIDYGVPMRFESNKVGFYLVVGQWVGLAGLVDAPLAVFRSSVLATVAGSALAAWVWLRAQTTHLAFAVFGSVCVLALPWTVNKLSGFRGESFALPLFFAVLWLGDRALRCRGWRWPFALSAALTTLAASHLVSAAAAALFLTALAVGHASASPERALRSIARVATAGAAAFVVLLGISLTAGEPSWQSEASLTQSDSTPLYRGRDGHVAFRHLARNGLLDESVPLFSASEGFFEAPSATLADLFSEIEEVFPWLGEAPRALAAGLAAAACLALAAHGGQSRRWGVALATLFALMLCWGLAFSLFYDGQAAALHPARREFPYLGFGVIAGLVVLLDWIHGQSESGAGIAPSPPTRRVVSLCLAAALLAGPARAGWKQLETPRGASPHAVAALEALAWLREHSPADARVVLNAATDGVVDVVAQRACVTEGRAPYFQGANLILAAAALEDARSFFLAPAASSFPKDYDIDYVVVSAGYPFVGRPFAVAQSLRHLPEHFEVVARFETVDVYRVLPGGS